MKNIILVLVLCVLSSCGKDNPAAVASKSLFSSWAADDGSEVLDLSSATMGAGQAFGLQLTTGEICACSMAIGGTEASATAVLTGCAYISGGGGDPGCASLNASYSMVNTAAKLTLCGSSCTTYH